MREWRSKAVFVVWAALVAYATLFVWRTVNDVLGTASLAGIAVAAFLVPVLFAGPPKFGVEDLSYSLTVGNVFRATGILLGSVVTGIVRWILLVLVTLVRLPVWGYRAWRARGERPMRQTMVEHADRDAKAYAPKAVADRVPFLRALSVLIRAVMATLRVCAVFAATVALGGAVVLGLGKEKFLEQVPSDMGRVTAYDPAVSTDVYDVHGELICSFNRQFRVRVPMDKVDPKIVAALIAAEDAGFYDHHGIDPMAIARAFIHNLPAVLAELRHGVKPKGNTTQGGSTITQQVVKQVLLQNSERTYTRKVQEIILAVEMERRLTKRQILEIFLNHVFLGRGAYGVEAASQTYFGKSASDLTLAEAAILAGLPQAPSNYSPYAHYPRARWRMRYVLDRMKITGATVNGKKITEAEYRQALAEEVAIVTVADELNHSSAPYFCAMVRKELESMFPDDVIFARGIVVRTTLDMPMQRIGESVVRTGLLDLERKLGFAGPEGRIDAYDGRNGCPEPSMPMDDGALGQAVVVDNGKTPMVCMRGLTYPIHPEDVVRIRTWEKRHQPLAPGDTLTMRIETFTEPPRKGDKGTATRRYALPARRTGGADVPQALQASLVVVDPRTGAIPVLVPGFDFMENQFNNATQGLRQTGSAVKPFVYGTGLKLGMTVVDELVDRPICYAAPLGPWCPKNYENKFLGRMRLKPGLAKSQNSLSVQIGVKVGVHEVIRTMRNFGITAPLDPVKPLFVGSEDVSPWEMSLAYAGIAAGGKRLPQRPGSKFPGVFITRVEDYAGKTLFSYQPVPREQWPQALPPAVNYELIELMRGVAEQGGTGQRMRELRRPVAGKTGTANSARDVWFFGLTTDMVAGCWVGRQSPKFPIGPEGSKVTGGSVALPFCLSFMKQAHPNTPVTDFPPPADAMLIPDHDGQLIPFQQGKIPEEYLVSGTGIEDPL